MKKNLSILAQLFTCFLKIGAFTFGGGYAMISIIQHACVEQKKWITEEELLARIRSGEILDGMTQTAMLFYQLHKK